MPPTNKFPYIPKFTLVKTKKTIEPKKPQKMSKKYPIRSCIDVLNVNKSSFFRGDEINSFECTNMSNYFRKY